ncbi:hypothetical protein B0H67DRAFT_592885 [Lasiosphaeris hirsuta]|uniref:BZIP transcription factor n=1 Tax=Lasiosphaeris hirsuta TaxID=260670 RepID=A0AA39ZWL1_9PEZI|nr:hypothetical protein B0H67DRAFT_592885 [Lasiosphaeris hirsuta]
MVATSPADSQHSMSFASPGSGHANPPPPGDAGAGSESPGPDDPPGGKKRKTRPGSRGVANLTPDQLAKKRANDREAQRAIRERQRLRNELYEREIRELKSQQPYQELQAAIQQKAAVEAEMAEIKQCLASIITLIEPILGRPAADSPAVNHPASQHQPQQQPSQPLLHTESTPTSAASPASVGTYGRWYSDHSPVVSSVTVDAQSQDSPPTGLFNQQRHDLIHGLELSPERLNLSFVLDPTHKVAKIQNGLNGAQDSPIYSHVPMKHDWTSTKAAPRHSPPPLLLPHCPFGGQPAVPMPLLPPRSDFVPAQPPPQPPPPPFGPNTEISAAPFKNSAPTCPLDSILLDFLAERRQRTAEGLSAQEIVGPRYPSVSSLLNPSISRYSHPLSKVFTDILARFPDLSTLPERVAVLYIMFLIMRWQISPTEENYTRLPPWVRACPLQLTRPHPAWIDHVPFPRMRERLIGGHGPAEFPFENFFIPFTTTLRLNWPYEDVDALLQSPVGDEIMINPVFERHLRRLENWTLGDAFHDAYPMLEGTYNLRSEREGGVVKLAL